MCVIKTCWLLFVALLVAFNKADIHTVIVSGRLVCCIDPTSHTKNVSKTLQQSSESQCPTFFCPEVNGAIVQIIEKDTVGSDDVLATVRSQPNGFYSAIGSEDEMFGIEVEVVVTHRCGISGPNCVIKTTVSVPDAFIDSCSAFDIDPFDLFNNKYSSVEECK